jgi:hypothetical protein
MSHLLQVSLDTPFPAEDLIARVDQEGGGHSFILLKNGIYAGPIPARAVKITLTLEPTSRKGVLDGTSRMQAQRDPQPAEIDDLFVSGIEVPSDGVLVAQVHWGAACHSDHVPSAPEGKRFASSEHMICANWVGKDGIGTKAQSLKFHGIAATFDSATWLTLGSKHLAFGDIICLAGDFYAHLDRDAEQEFDWAWPETGGFAGWLEGDYRGVTLAGDSLNNVKDLLGVVNRDKDANRSAAGEFAHLAFDTIASHYPARRYLALASQNYCHFGCEHPGFNPDNNEALRLYRSYHKRAIRLVTKAPEAADPEQNLYSALVVDAFGCHFLTDLFASGHSRVPRRLLGETYGILRGALKMSNDMHEEDNVRGLWCRPSRNNGNPVVWRAYGDNMLREEVSGQHLLQVQEAVRRSAAEVFAAYCAAMTKSRCPEVASAEDLVPVPLASGEGPGVTDVLPDGSSPPRNAPPNHWPLFWFDGMGKIVRRNGAPEVNDYSYVDDPGQTFAYRTAI